MTKCGAKREWYHSICSVVSVLVFPRGVYAIVIMSH